MMTLWVISGRSRLAAGVEDLQRSMHDATLPSAILQRPGVAMELTIHQAIYSTRAMRRLKPDPVPAEDLRYIIDAATQAPTGQNQQLWSFVVLVDPEPRQRLAELYRELGRKIVKPVAEDPNVPEDQRRAYRGAMVLVEELAEVPALILVCHTGEPPTEAGAAAAYYGSVFPAIQNLMLAARSRGLGTTLTTLHKMAEGRVKRMLGIPDEVSTVALIPVGYPRGKWGPPKRRPSAKVTHWNCWGNQSD